MPVSNGKEGQYRGNESGNSEDSTFSELNHFHFASRSRELIASRHQGTVGVIRQSVMHIAPPLTIHKRICGGTQCWMQLSRAATGSLHAGSAGALVGNYANK